MVDSNEAKRISEEVSEKEASEWFTKHEKEIDKLILKTSSLGENNISLPLSPFFVENFSLLTRKKLISIYNKAGYKAEIKNAYIIISW